MIISAVLYIAAFLLGGTLLTAAANLLGARASALAEPPHPRELRGRYLAAFQ